MPQISTVRATTAVTPYSIALSNDLGHVWAADEPLEAGGGNRGPSPHQLLLSSLGACSAITLKMYAERKQWPLESASVELHIKPGAAVGTDIVRRITLQGDLTPEQRERLLQVANACPLHRLLTGEVRIQTDLQA